LPFVARTYSITVKIRIPKIPVKREFFVFAGDVSPAC